MKWLFHDSIFSDATCIIEERVSEKEWEKTCLMNAIFCIHHCYRTYIYEFAMNKRCQYANLFFSHSRFFFRSLICKIRKTCNLHKFAVDEKNCKWKKWNKNHVGRARDIFLSYKCTTFCCYFSLTHRWLLVSIADSLSCSRRCNWGIFLCKFSFLRNLQLNF